MNVLVGTQPYLDFSNR